MTKLQKVFCCATVLTALALHAWGAETEVTPPQSKTKADPAEKTEQAGRSPDQMIERIDAEVGGLSADQKAKIRDVYASYAALPRTERRGKMAEIEQKVRALLTAEQQKKFDEAMSHRRGRARNSGRSEVPSKQDQ